jgi:hypothetical protein
LSISSPFLPIGFAQADDTYFLISLSIDQDMQDVTDEAHRYLTQLSIVFAIVEANIGSIPIKIVHRRKVDAVHMVVQPSLFVIPVVDAHVLPLLSSCTVQATFPPILLNLGGNLVTLSSAIARKRQ